MTEANPLLPAGSCATRGCPGHFRHPDFGPKTLPLIRKGFYRRSSDRRKVQRFQCRFCGRGSSDATHTLCYRQKKRHLNPVIDRLLNAGISERETSRMLGIRWETVSRKIVFLGVCSLIWHRRELGRRLREKGPIREIQFDEMETFEHSKWKPLSLPLAIDPKTRAILDIRVASMPARGLMAARAREKYGNRADDRPKVAGRLWKNLRPFLAQNPDILSDMNPKYPGWIEPHFPEAIHRTVKGRRGCVVGQGELKRGGFDPLFALNHTAAMLRANINRLFRRTWCTTKLAWKLEMRLWMYVRKHNVAVGWQPA
jgi:hypothetical protein